MDINTIDAIIEIAKKSGITIEKNKCNMEVKQMNLNDTIKLLKDQLSIMNDYLYALEVRAEIEQIQLDNI